MPGKIYLMNKIMVSADGSFGHWKYKVRLNRQMREDRRKKLIDTILNSKRVN